MKNKNVDIYFFSGTGNTYLAAKKIAETFRKNECEVNLIPIEKADPTKIDLSKTIGLGFTIACWNTYPLVRKFFENLPQTLQTEIFVFTTMGDSSLKTAANVGNMLSKKGYDVIGARGFRMPNNFISVRPPSENEAKIQKAYLKIESYALDIIHGTAKAEKASLFFRICHKITKFITNTWKWKISQKLMQLKLDKEKCVKCGLCAEICPAKNIEYTQYPVFNGNRCQLCLRCISYCPSQAINKWFIFKTYKALETKEIKEWLR